MKTPYNSAFAQQAEETAAMQDEEKWKTIAWKRASSAGLGRDELSRHMLDPWSF